MKTLQKWLERRKQKPIEDSFYIQGYNDACDHLITLLPSLTATLETEILEMVGKDEHIDHGEMVEYIYALEKSNKEKARMRTAIITYFKRDI